MSSHKLRYISLVSLLALATTYIAKHSKTTNQNITLNDQERSNAKGFSINLVGSDCIARFNLTAEQGFWKIAIKNNGPNLITFVVDGPKTSDIISIHVHQTKSIYNKSKWPAGTYTAIFTCGSDMKGAASCRTASSVDELDLSKIDSLSVDTIDPNLLPKVTTQSFNVNLNDCGTTYTTRFNLTTEQSFWKVTIKNIGSQPIIYSTEGPQNSPVYKIPAGTTKIVYSKIKWPAGTYTANFSSDANLQGSASCIVASKFDELNIPS